MASNAREPATAESAPPRADADQGETSTGAMVYLEAAGPTPARVLMVLRQSLGLSPRDAQAYVASAPVLLAVDVPPDIAERFAAAMTSAGAIVRVRAPLPSPMAVEPEPEPVRRMAVQMRRVRPPHDRPGARIVTGLDLGYSCAHLSYVRADRDEVVTHVDLVRVASRTAVPAGVRLADDGSESAIGARALEAWPGAPASVRTGMLAGLMAPDGTAPLRLFAEGLARRAFEVLGAVALDATTGASTNLGVPVDWPEQTSAVLAETIRAAGFPVATLVPWPLAALAHHEHQGAMQPPDRRENVLVVDWGGSSLRLSLVERGEGLAQPAVIGHREAPLGGDWFDATVLDWMLPQLASDLGEEERRALALFAREYKEQMSLSFVQGKVEHSQYCVVSVGAPPRRLRLRRGELEAMYQPALVEMGAVLNGAVADAGLQPRHIEHVILCGGSARWHFAREVIRTALGRVPHIGPRPEEAVACGLAVYGLAL